LLVSSILYILLLISGIFFANLNYQQRYISHLQSELKKLKDENKKALEMFFSVNVISKHTNYDKSFLFYYNKLSNIMLHEVRFGSLEFIKNEGVNLRVEADDETYLSEFVDALNKDSLFKSVKTAYIRKHKEPDRPIAEFGLMCRM
jgi:hypothetical protein